MAVAIAALAMSPADGVELLPPQQYRAIRDNSSGERPLADFANIVRYSGFMPSAGAEQVANYMAAAAKTIGLSNVSIEHSPSDEQPYLWTFRKEPSWEARKGQLWLVSPQPQLLADFQAIKGVLARFSRNTDVTAELVDVGVGTDPKDYAERNVEGKIVLASGPASLVMQMAVWQRKALGVVYYRTEGAEDFPDHIGMVQIVPWLGPHGELPTFAFSISYRSGRDLAALLAGGKKLTVRAEVEVDTGPGPYVEVSGEIPGSDPSLPVILVNAHDNSRNTGGANNLTGVGCTLEMARLLNGLISSGVLPKPRRTIRFMWGAEHSGLIFHFHEHPEDLNRILAMINIDMIGYNQQTARAVLHLYRSPASNPSFVDDVVQAFLDQVGAENGIALHNTAVTSDHPAAEGFTDPLFAPTGSRQQLQYAVDPFWGPSDHEDVQTLGVRAIMLNDFPDVFLSTQDDSVTAADATQMRRGVVLSAAAAYFLAVADRGDTASLLANASQKAQKRLVDDEVKAIAYLAAADAPSLPAAYANARNVIMQAKARENTSLRSLVLLIDAGELQQAARPYIADLEAISQMSLRRVQTYATQRAGTLGVSPGKLLDHTQDSGNGARSYPIRATSIRGPVNLFRPEYGRWWLIEKTGDAHFEKTVPLAARGPYTAYEALNLANGRRSVAEIRDIVSAEFEPVPVGEVAQFFRFMQKVGVVRVEARPTP